MIRFESSTKINFISPALRAWGWGTLLIMQWASEVAYLSSYVPCMLLFCHGTVVLVTASAALSGFVSAQC